MKRHNLLQLFAVLALLLCTKISLAEDLHLICEGIVSGRVHSHGGFSKIDEYREIRTIQIIKKRFQGESAVIFSDSQIEYRSNKMFLSFDGLELPMWSVNINRYSGMIRQSEILVEKFGGTLFTAFRYFNGQCKSIDKKMF